MITPGSRTQKPYLAQRIASDNRFFVRPTTRHADEETKSIMFNHNFGPLCPKCDQNFSLIIFLEVASVRKRRNLGMRRTKAATLRIFDAQSSKYRLRPE
ncbi:hypothetical protein [Asticcacaulis excentricus]|uniref:hypothetical protein n=1 Tax=Asticcacaulis excentricus TaxID=78587 RepID=UPI001180C5CA|nr:hypothetical protein [Asticcacaulis excentricus]